MWLQCAINRQHKQAVSIKGLVVLSEKKAFNMIISTVFIKCSHVVVGLVLTMWLKCSLQWPRATKSNVLHSVCSVFVKLSKKYKNKQRICGFILKQDPPRHSLRPVRETCSYFAQGITGHQLLDSGRGAGSGLCVSPLPVNELSVCVSFFAWGLVCWEGGADAQTQSREGNSEQNGACTVAEFTENTPPWYFPAGLCWGVGLFMFPFEPNHHEAGSYILFLSWNAFISVALCHSFVKTLASLTSASLLSQGGGGSFQWFLFKSRRAWFYKVQHSGEQAYSWRGEWEDW